MRITIQVMRTMVTHRQIQRTRKGRSVSGKQQTWVGGTVIMRVYWKKLWIQSMKVLIGWAAILSDWLGYSRDRDVFFLSFFFSFIFISWRLITLQYCSGFCHTLTWISHGFTCVPHPDPPSCLPPHPIPLVLSSALEKLSSQIVK